MLLSDMIEGLKTLQPYYCGCDGHHISAEHDQIYVTPTDRPLTPDDVQKLYGLGWFQPGHVDVVDSYDPTVPWSAFT